MESITLNPMANFEKSVKGEIVAFNIGFDGACYLAAATKETSFREIAANGCSFPKSVGNKDQAFRIYRECDGDFHLTLTTEKEPFNISFVQPLIDGNYLLATARSRFQKGNPEENARIYDPNGQLLDSFTLGDGIEDIQVAQDGMIWTSYFDEGILGNFGWNDPLGSPGLVCWTPEGKKDYEYQPPAGLDYIIDCYAMNINGTETWIYYYSDFPLVQLKNGAVKNYGSPPVSGSHAFSVGKSSILFMGGYDNHDDFCLINRENMSVEKRFILADAEGNQIKATMKATRNDSIFLLAGKNIYQLSISQL